MTGPAPMFTSDIVKVDGNITLDSVGEWRITHGRTPLLPSDSDRSGFAEFGRTGRYPLRADIGERCETRAAQILTIPWLVRTAARRRAMAKAWRRATAEVPLSKRGRRS